MGAFDSAEITDLVGLYILYIFKDKIKEIDFGLYRDDMLGFLKNLPQTKVNSIYKKLKELLPLFLFDTLECHGYALRLVGLVLVLCQ